MPPAAFRPSLAERAQYTVLRLLLRLPPRALRWLAHAPAGEVDGHRVDAQLRLVRVLRRWRVRGASLTEPTVAAGRARFRREALAFRGSPTRVAVVHDREIATADGPLRARHYVPLAAHAVPLVVFYHGGGWAIGDLDTHDEACRILCAAGMHVLSVDYRLAPEHPYPAALRDAYAAFRWARANAENLGADPRRVAVGGDSAGGGLATVVARLGMHEGAPPAAQLLVYPVVALADEAAAHAHLDADDFLTPTDLRVFVGLYLGGSDIESDDPCVSPLFAEDLHGMPPALVVTAGFDPLRDAAESYVSRLLAAGVTVRAWREPSLAHGFLHVTGLVDAARRATQRLAGELRALLDERP